MRDCNMVNDTIQRRLLHRELQGSHGLSSVRGIYGHRSWVEDLDIVNELGGHTGCVNALSWSTSGRLLASGSDDQHLNIHTYQPQNTTAPFHLTTQVATGHTANIFSAKFMPHSADHTLVTAAGDAEVRVFDIEYAGRSSEASRSSARGRANQQNALSSVYDGSRYLHDGNTNCRIYRSHGDRVKRIVTESSPYLFLTCSEDGTVRQFDLRQPSSAYPAPRGRRCFLGDRSDDNDNPNVPPPLISYKRYNLDLNTISCSASRPHYIALGGAHLHCFLHDRRMLGRNLDDERGVPSRASPASDMTPLDEEHMSEATRCVRKFAPAGIGKAKRRDERHITACKISDANPNDLIVSWSGDHIYNFDIVNDQTGQTDTMIPSREKKRLRASRDRKRKRRLHHEQSPGSARKSSRPSPDIITLSDSTTVRLEYDGGRHEDVHMNDLAPTLPNTMLEQAREAVLTESQKRSLQIAKSTTKIRQMLFSLEATKHVNPFAGPDQHVASFTAALGLAATCYPDMKEVSGEWGYPVNPEEADIMLQKTLRAHRDSALHFVQASGTLAHFLGGKLQTSSRTDSPMLTCFKEILRAQPNNPPLSTRETFCYLFLRSILLWLQGGISHILQGFGQDPSLSRRSSSEVFSFPPEADESAVHDLLLPKLSALAGQSPVSNVDVSRFEHDSTRHLFETETAAVSAFGRAVKMPLQDMTGVAVAETSQASDMPAGQNRQAAVNFWAFKVGRGLLLNAGEGINLQYVDTAFGGLGNHHGAENDHSQEDIDEQDDLVVERAHLVRNASHSRGNAVMEERDAEMSIGDETDNNDDDNEDYESDDDDDNEENDELVEDDETADAAHFLFRSTYEPGHRRRDIQGHVPCTSHSRLYRGHCNVKTVKDANFFGLQDDYVVSGSDAGHIFIWDKKTSQLVNILQGDSEVVNVIQGHPHEPLIAASGIDNTVKIFSPDSRAQEDARMGINVEHRGSISATRRSRRLRPVSNAPPYEGDNFSSPDRVGLASCRRQQQSYEIVSKNDAMRQSGVRDAFITRGMLAQIAARLRARREGAGGAGGIAGVTGGDGGDGEDEDEDGAGGLVLSEDGEAIVLDPNCRVM